MAELKIVDPKWIEEQRELGWPDMHPEDYCHRCGMPNTRSWCAPREDWLLAVSKWAEETGREGICCPKCFAEMYEEATGSLVTMVISPWRGDWSLHLDPLAALANARAVGAKEAREKMLADLIRAVNEGGVALVKSFIDSNREIINA